MRKLRKETIFLPEVFQRIVFENCQTENTNNNNKMHQQQQNRTPLKHQLL